MSASTLKRYARRAIGVAAAATWPLRRDALTVLTYHRVLPEVHPERQLEQPGMVVSPETLAMHLETLKGSFEVVDLADWIARRENRVPLPPRACSITFDDGWRDNYQYALPVLERAGVPATIFLVADFIGSSYEFWPNRLARLIAGRDGQGTEPLPEAVRDLLRRVDAPSWIESPTGRSVAERIDAAINACKALPDQAVQDVLATAETRREAGEASRPRQLLDESEIARMGRSGQIRFGSHGRRHLRLLPGLAPEIIDQEVRGSRERLRELTGQPIDLFCYPNGDHCPAAVAAVREAYAGAVTTQSGWNGPATDRCLLTRASIHDDIATDRWSLYARISALA